MVHRIPQILILLVLTVCMGYASVEVSAEGRRSLNVRLHFGTYSVYERNGSGGRISVISSETANADTLVGDLSIPMKRFALALPGEDFPELRILSVRTSPLSLLLKETGRQRIETEEGAPGADAERLSSSGKELQAGLSEPSVSRPPSAAAERVLETLKHREHDLSPIILSEIMYFQNIPYRLISVPALQADAQLILEMEIELSWKRDFQGVRPAYFPLIEGLFVNGASVRVPIPDRVLRKTGQTLPDGTWIELTVPEEGIYAVDHSDLQALGLDPSEIDRSSVRVYTGRPMGQPYSSELPDLDSLWIQLPALFLAGSTGTWSSEDRLIFYAPGPDHWKIRQDGLRPGNMTHHVNPFDSEQHVWILIPDDLDAAPGHRMDFQPAVAGSVLPSADWHWAAFRHEKDEQNILQGGLNWYGESFSGLSAQKTLRLELPVPVAVDAVQNPILRIGAAGGSTPKTGSHEHSFTFALNSADLTGGITLYSFAFGSREYSYPLTSLGSSNTLVIDYRGSSDLNLAFLDYVDIIYPAVNQAVDDRLRLRFRDRFSPFSFGADGFSSYPVYAFDISDPSRPLYSILSTSSERIEDTRSIGTADYLLLTEEGFSSPASILLRENAVVEGSRWLGQAVDMVVISHRNFMAEAERLAEHKRERMNEPLNTLAVDVEDIFSAYAAGQNDPYAIRNFLLDLYRHHGNPDPASPPRFVLLLGDGSYDYKNITGQAKNFVPQFEISEGHIYHTRNTEDPFVYLSSDNDLTVDMAVGRLAVNSVAEAAAIVDKIISYENREYPGKWQGHITLVADDPTDPDDNYPNFINNTEGVIQSQFPKSLLRNKIYLTEFPELYDASIRAMGRVGSRDAIIRAFNEGTSIVNWIGHGSPTVWAQEYIFVKDRDLPLLNNQGMYPFIMAATCDWGRSDYVASQSAAEDIVSLPNAGAIASLATTRPVFDSANVDFVTNYFGLLFYHSTLNTRSMTIGEALIGAKHLSRNYLNTSKYILFGDPSMKLAIPEHSGRFDSGLPDTLHALDKVDAAAELYTWDGSEDLDDQMTAELRLYDSEQSVTRSYRYFVGGTWFTDYISYRLPGKPLFNGTVTVTDRELQASFIIPKDISYQGNSAMLRLQYWNADRSREGLFSRNDLSILGSSGQAQTDFSGPVIAFERHDGRDLVEGDVVQDTTLIYIALRDENGINITGSTGHQITLSKEDGSSLDISAAFAYDRDSYTEGHIPLRAGDMLPIGSSRFEVSAFDNYNNFSSRSMELTVLEAGDQLLDAVVNFPNPFSRSTQFTFQAALPGEADITIYSPYGRRVRSLQGLSVMEGFNFFDWDGRDSFGQTLAAGPYFYRIHFRSDGGREFENTGTCIKVP